MLSVSEIYKEEDSSFIGEYLEQLTKAGNLLVTCYAKDAYEAEILFWRFRRQLILAKKSVVPYTLILGNKILQVVVRNEH